MSVHIPDRGDIVWLDYNPRLGHEQAAKRPALVMSPEEYNKRVGLALFFPITSQIKGYPFEVGISLSRIDGVILADQIKSLDWKARGIQYIESAPEEILLEVRSRLDTILE